MIGKLIKCCITDDVGVVIDEDEDCMPHLLKVYFFAEDIIMYRTMDECELLLDK